MVMMLTRLVRRPHPGSLAKWRKGRSTAMGAVYSLINAYEGSPLARIRQSKNRCVMLTPERRHRDRVSAVDAFLGRTRPKIVNQSCQHHCHSDRLPRPGVANSDGPPLETDAAN